VRIEPDEVHAVSDESDGDAHDLGGVLQEVAQQHCLDKEAEEADQAEEPCEVECAEAQARA
jgi:hypothetical protein